MTTEQERADTLADYRRAAALIIHFGRDDGAGVNAVLDEANEADRATELVVALLMTYNSIVPEVRTDLGMKLMTDYLLRIAGEQT
ncbi:MAG TPA: hypothetical protein VNP20_17220 [Nocardioidaceae bacterium]|nr:hypothetical protein [Nocardioidaceae bacterium]